MYIGSTIGAISYTSGALAFALLVPLCILLQRQKHYPSILVAACIMTVVRCLSAILYSHFDIAGSALLVVDFIFYALWLLTLFSTVKHTTRQPLPTLLRQLVAVVYTAAAIFAMASYGFYGADLQMYASETIIWCNIVLPIISLILIEQFYKNINNAHKHSIKFFSWGLASLFAYELYLYTQALIFQAIPLDSWLARGWIYAIAGLFFLFTLKQKHTPQLTLSRKIVFYTTSLTSAGILLFVMAGVGFYMQIYGGSWGGALQQVLTFATILSVAVLFSLGQFRAYIVVLINKHFFSHKYDYRNEWLNLIQILSQPVEQDNLQKRTIKAVANIFGCPGGALWQRQQQLYIPSCESRCPLPEAAIQTVDSPFVHALRDKEWVFEAIGPQSTKYPENLLLPEWANEIKDLWIVLPLLNENDLLGFMCLQKPAKKIQPLSWEDLDLLKTVGRQIASYLARHEASEQLSQSRQFDTYNKLTAFIMHDLKNLIAQQALVVQNASKHKNNPEFFEDAISTIDNSVNRMSSLLAKLQSQSRSINQTIPLEKVIHEAIKKCRYDYPQPAFSFSGKQRLEVNADIDTFTMVLTHLIKNAQEATPNDGDINIHLSSDNDRASIAITDTGSGMSESFIRQRLFKPFETTKSGKGMGIGVFQAREYIHSLQGELSVSSQPNKGSVFNIAVPLLETSEY